MSERAIEPQGGYGSANPCKECGSFHSDSLAHQRVRTQERRRELLAAVRDGARFVAETDFEAAGVGARGHLIGAPRSVAEFRDPVRHGRTVRFNAGDEVDAATVQELVALHGRDLPVKVAPPEQRPAETGPGGPAVPDPAPDASGPSVWDRLAVAFGIDWNES